MKRLFLCFLVVACGSTTTGTDGGNPSDASQDQTATDGASDSSSNDSAMGNDGASGGDGGLQVGATCDPNNNQCASGLLCCSEPTHMPDASTGYFCEKPVNKICPMLP